MSSKRNLVRIVGSGGGKGGAHEHYEADDNMFARQSAAFIDAIAEGPIKGLVYGDASILIDEVRLRDVNQVTGEVSGTTNVNNFSVITAPGTADQVPDPEFFSEFPTAATMQEIGSPELLLDEPQYFTLSSGQFEKNNADYIKVTISTSGMQQITKTGKTKGDVHETYVYFDIDFKWIDNVGVAKTQNMFRTGFQGKVSGNYAHTFGFNIEDIKNQDGMTDWSIRVTRVGGRIDSDDLEVTNAVYVNSIEVSIADKLSYPYTAYVAGTIDAEQFSSVPSRGYEIDGKLIQIPSNHVPIDYNGRKTTVASVTSLNVGDTISQTGSISTLTATGNADDGYVGIATLSGNHGVSIGKTFITTIATTANGADDEFWEGEFIVEATAVNQFTYKLNQPYNQTAEAYKILGSTTCGGTKTAELFTGGIIDKIVGYTVYLRDVPANSTVLIGQGLNNGTVAPNVTAAEQVVIPANYRRNSATEKVTSTERDWDGTFYTVWCNNPAWVFNDLITNKIYGLGNYLSQVQINKWELYQIGRYCDELVPAGVEAADLLSIYTTNEANYTGSTGEWEPRFSANLVIAGKQEAFKVLNDVVGMFRGMIYWLNGEAYVVQDSEKDPVYQFTNANVVNGEFKYEGTSRKTRTNQIIVGWNNPQDYYRSRQEIVELEETLQKDDEFLKPDSTTAFGCTSRGQARRLGKWKLLSNNLHTNTITFDTSFNGAFLRPGDIIQVIDQHKDGKSWGGRVATGSDTDDIIIDRKPTGFGDTSPESGYAVGDYRLTCSFVGNKVVLAQDTIALASTTYVRGDELPKTYFTTILIEDGGVGYAAGTTVAVSGSATADVLVEDGVITRVDVVQAAGYSSNPTLTIGNAGSGTGAILTPYLSDTEPGSKNLKDDSGNLIFTQFIPFHYTETRFLDEVSNSGKTLGVSAVFSAAPTAESIWILSRAALTTGKEKYEARLYRILQLTEKDRNAIEIQALDYNATKFDNVDKNEALSPDRQIFLPDSFLSVPAVTNIDYVATLAFTAENSPLIDRIAFNWDPPRNADTTPYTFVRHYEVFYSKDNFKWFKAGTTTNTEIVKDSIGGSGTYYVRVYTVSLQGKRSPVATATLQVDFQRAVGPSEGSVGRSQWTINKIGTISGSFGINGGTGIVAFTPANFFHNDAINEHTVASQPNLDFSDLSDGDDGWVYFSHKENKFKAMTIDTDSTVGNASYYGTVEADQFYPVGSNVFAAGTGTLSFDTSSISSATTSNHTITGSGTNFQEASAGARDGELALDNVFSFTKSSITYYHRAKTITSDTVLKTHQPVVVTNSSQAFNKPTYLTDYTNDSIMGKVHRTSATSYTLEPYGIRRSVGQYNVSGTNEVHTFIGDSDDGEIEAAHYTAYFNEYTITKDGVTFAFKDGGTASNTFGLSCVAVTGFDATNKIDIDEESDSNPGRVKIVDNSLDTVTVATATIRITDLADATTIADRVLSFTKVTGGSGTTGLNAKTVRLDAGDYSIVYDQNGENPSPSGNIVLTATAQNLVNDGYFKFTGEEITPEGSLTVGTVGDPVTGDTFNFPVPALLSNLTNPATVKVEMQDGSSGGIIASDSITISAVQPGTSAYTVSQTNATHAIPADANGNNAVLTGTGTIFEVFKGGSNLLPKMSGTPGANEFSVTAGTDTGITASTNVDRVNDAGAEGTASTHNRIKFNAHTSLTAATAEIEYAVNCEDEQTLLVNQTFTRTNEGEAGSPAKTILVSPSSHIMTKFTEPDEGQTTTEFYNPTAITVRGITNNTTADGVWSSTSGAGSFTVVSSAHDATPGPSVTVSGAQLVDGMTVTYTLAPADGSGSDSTTLEKVEAGSNQIDVVFTNESHTYVTDNDGGSNPVYTGSGMDIYCYEGGSRSDYVTGTPVRGQWTVAQGSLGGLSGLAITANGTTSGRQTLDTTDHFLRVGPITGSTVGTDVDTVTYTITGRKADNNDEFSFTKVQTLTKAKRGAKAVDLSISSSSNVFNFDDSSDTTPTPSTVLITVVQQAQLTNLATTDLTVTNGSKNTGTYTAGSETGTGTMVWTVTPSGTYPTTCSVTNDNLTKSIVLTKVVGGDDSVDLSISSSTNVFNFDDSTDTTPTPTTATITAIQSNQASDLVTTDLTVTNGSKNTATITGSAGSKKAIWTVTPSGTYPVTCSVTRASITKSVVITKTVGGDIGVTGASVNIIFKRSATVLDGDDTPDDSPGVPSGWADAPPAGNVGGTLLLYASRGSKAAGADDFVWTTPFQIEGEEHAEIYIFRKVASIGSVSPAGTYNFVTNFLTLPTNWYKDPPALTADGDKVYVAVGLVSGDSKATAAIPVWGTPAVYAQRTDGTAAISSILSNENHALPASSAGVVSDYTGSGTTIKVYEGETALTFQTGTVLAGQFAVAIGNNVNITEGGASGDESTTCTIGVHSAAANGTDSFVITYTISGKFANGTSFTTFTKDQTLTKQKAGAVGTTGADTVPVYKKISGNTQPDTPADGAANPPSGWVSAFPTAQAGHTIWIMIGKRAAGATDYVWADPFVFAEPHGIAEWFDGNFDFNFLGESLEAIAGGADDLGSYLNSNDPSPTHTTSGVDPTGTAVTGSTHYKTGVVPPELWIYGTSWVHQTVNTDSFPGSADETKLDAIAANATKNTVYNGNTTLRGNTTGTAGDFFYDESLGELYVWES